MRIFAVHIRFHLMMWAVCFGAVIFRPDAPISSPKMRAVVLALLSTLLISSQVAALICNGVRQSAHLEDICQMHLNR